MMKPIALVALWASLLLQSPPSPLRPTGRIVVRPTPTPAPAAAAPPTPQPRPTPPAFRKPRLLWKTNLKRCDATPAVADRQSFVCAQDTLYHLDSGGRIVWATEVGATQSAPLLDTTTVYVGTDRGQLLAIDRKTGRVRWRFAANNVIRNAPALGAGRLIVEALDNNLYALDAATGARRWSFARPDGSLGYSAPLLTRENSLFACGESYLYRLDPETGKEIWKAFVGGKSLSTPAHDSGRVFVSGDGTGLTAYSQDSGQRLWRFPGVAGPGGADWFGPPLVAANTVYVSTYRRYVYAVDSTTGKMKWSCRLPGAALSAPAFDERRNVIYVTSGTFRNNPTLTAIHSRSGVKLWDYPLGYVSAAPILTSDRLFVGSTNGNYYAFAID